MLGKLRAGEEGDEMRVRWLDGTTDAMDTSLSKLQEMVEDGSLVCCSPRGCKESGTT